MLEDQLTGWQQRHESDEEAARPQLFDMDKPTEVKGLEALLENARDLVVVDRYDEMLRELFVVERPPLKYDPSRLKKEYDAWLANHQDGKGGLIRCGVWAYYPWSERLIHIPHENEYYRLRTARNHNLVTAEEQTKLHDVRVGIIGLSVGQAPALTLTISGIGHNLRLADPDAIDASNLNRIHAGVADVGVKKTVVLSRRVTEIDPYAEPELHPSSITEDNIEGFFTKNGKLDIVIDAFDDVKMKIKLRLAARKHKVAVLMATDVSDGSIVEIERYDLNQQLPIFGGRVNEQELGTLPAVLGKDDMARMAMMMIGIQTPPPRMMDSIRGLGTHIAGYPQLALASFLGGSLATYVIKRIALGATDLPPRVSISYDELFS